MAQFEKHLFICTNHRAADHPRGCCENKGSEKIRELLKAAVAERGLKRKVRINAAGCLDQCEHGVTIVVYPEAVWYGFVKENDVAEIVESHLVNGRPVERLRLAPDCVNTAGCAHKGKCVT